MFIGDLLKKRRHMVEIRVLQKKGAISKAESYLLPKQGLNLLTSHYVVSPNRLLMNYMTV